MTIIVRGRTTQQFQVLYYYLRIFYHRTIRFFGAQENYIPSSFYTSIILHNDNIIIICVIPM